MKVLLIGPYINIHSYINEKEAEELNREDFFPSSALLHLAAMLRANDYEPLILDLNNITVHAQREKYFEYSKKTVIEALNEFKPDLVGINCLFSGTFPDVLEIAKTVKTHSPNLKIAIGGIHPTSFYREILANCKDVDFVAIGEGENSIVALAASVKEKNEKMLSSIKSFAFRDEKGVVHVNREKNYVEDLDALPQPAWDLINLNKFEMKLDHFYNPPKLPIKHRAAIFSSRACPLPCNFCDMFLVMGKKHRKRSVKTIVDEIELLNKEHGVNYFSFMDDQLTMNKGHIIELCNEILKRKIKIIFDTPNGLWVNSLREEVVAKMTEAGLVSATLAIEHGSDYIRNTIIGKNLDRQKIFEVGELLKKYKVMSTGLYIMGFPEETNETLQDTYDMMEELQLDKSSVSTLIPFPGTALFKQVVKHKLLIRDWNLDELWKTPISQAQREFIVKPFNMSLDDLHKWREKFDKILIKHWKTNSKAKQSEINATRRYSHATKKNALIYEST